jgi:hypothetical protein
VQGKIEFEQKFSLFLKAKRLEREWSVSIVLVGPGGASAIATVD